MPFFRFDETYPRPPSDQPILGIEETRTWRGHYNPVVRVAHGFGCFGGSYDLGRAGLA